MRLTIERERGCQPPVLLVKLSPVPLLWAKTLAPLHLLAQAEGNKGSTSWHPACFETVEGLECLSGLTLKAMACSDPATAALE